MLPSRAGLKSKSRWHQQPFARQAEEMAELSTSPGRNGLLIHKLTVSRTLRRFSVAGLPQGYPARREEDHSSVSIGHQMYQAISGDSTASTWGIKGTRSSPLTWGLRSTNASVPTWWPRQMRARGHVFGNLVEETQAPPLTAREFHAVRSH